MHTEVFCYPNLSRGGVSAVLRGRAAADPSTRFVGVFQNDRGGRAVFEDLPNVEVAVVPRDRRKSYIRRITESTEVSCINILSTPELVAELDEFDDVLVNYEFHSSNRAIVLAELAKFDVKSVDAIRFPSEYMANVVRPHLSRRGAAKVEVVPNLVDRRFFADGCGQTEPTCGLEGCESDSSGIPLLWIGRFDKDKGYRQFVRMLAHLPVEYHGRMVVSLEADPGRTAEFFSEVQALGVGGRVVLFSDVAPRELAGLMVGIRDRGGVLVSTSFNESFGYSIAEALEVALPVVAFELPVLSEHPRFTDLGTAVPIGDVIALAEAVEGAATAPVAH